MNNNILNYKHYFENSRFFELFNNVKYVWEIVPRIKDIIETKVGNGMVVGENSIIEKGAIIKPPVIIGKNCEIRSGAYIRGNVIIGDNCVIRTEIKNSLIMDNTKIAHPGYIGDSIIGSNCNFGINIALTNLKICNSNVKVNVNGNVYDTGLRKFGAIVGDGSSIGSNVVLNPGTLIGKNVIVYPLISLRGCIPENIIVKLKQELDFCKLKILDKNLLKTGSSNY